MSLLNIEKLTIKHQNNLILDNINLKLKSGEILGIAGQSGSGKSTLLKSILHLLPHNFEKINGDIYYRHQALSTLSEKELTLLRHKRFGFISQNANTALCPVVTIGKQLIKLLQVQYHTNTYTLQQEIIKLFAKLDFDDPHKIFNSYPFELSGGMNQRINIALNLLSQAEILLADEPTSALDIHTQDIILKELLNLAQNHSKSIILVSHNLNTLQKLADNIAILYQGKIIEYASCEHIFSSPQQAYTKQLISAANFSTT